MITFINDIPFSGLALFCIFAWVCCFTSAFKHGKKGEKAESILLYVVGFTAVPIILLRYIEEKQNNLDLQHAFSVFLCAYVVLDIVAVYIYSLIRYKRASLTYAERRKVLFALVFLPASIIFLAILILVWK